MCTLGAAWSSPQQLALFWFSPRQTQTHRHTHSLPPSTFEMKRRNSPPAVLPSLLLLELGFSGTLLPRGMWEGGASRVICSHSSIFPLPTSLPAPRTPYSCPSSPPCPVPLSWQVSIPKDSPTHTSSKVLPPSVPASQPGPCAPPLSTHHILWTRWSARLLPLQAVPDRSGPPIFHPRPLGGQCRCRGRLTLHTQAPQSDASCNGSPHVRRQQDRKSPVTLGLAQWHCTMHHSHTSRGDSYCRSTS